MLPETNHTRLVALFVLQKVALCEKFRLQRVKQQHRLLQFTPGLSNQSSII